jgi:hypothetical protein
MSVIEEVIKTLEILPNEEQREVLAFVQGLAVRHRRPQKSPMLLLEIAGTMDPDHVDKMMAAIDEECERIDPNEW